MTLKISIILPTFNAEKVISNALDSIFIQNFKNYEIIVVYRESIDKTYQILKRYEEIHPSLMKIYEFSVPGVYPAMNYGISKANGDFIYFMGSDDVLFNDEVLQNVSVLMDDGKWHILYGDVQLISTGERYTGAVSLTDLMFNFNICHQSIFYSKIIFSDGFSYNPKYTIWADWFLNIQIFNDSRYNAKWIDMIVAIYNDKTGLSSDFDPALKFVLPASLLNDLQIHLLKRGVFWIDLRGYVARKSGLRIRSTVDILIAKFISFFGSLTK